MGIGTALVVMEAGASAFADNPGSALTGMILLFFGAILLSMPVSFGMLFATLSYLDLTDTAPLVAVPQAMAYALIAGIPPVYGLYTAIIMTALASLFGSSAHLINGPTNAISLVVFSAVAGLSAGPDDQARTRGIEVLRLPLKPTDAVRSSAPGKINSAESGSAPIT